MENNQPPSPAVDYSANVDTSRAFKSVKEAVEVFGERFLTGEIFLPSPKPPFTLPKHETTPTWKSTQSSQISSYKSCYSPPQEIKEEQEPPISLVTSLKKLELELEETKKELKLLKERESETEVALASLNAELHKNMSKIAKAEAAEAAENSAVLRSSPSVTPAVSGGGGRKKTEKKVVKKKPIIPLLGDLFSKKKGTKPNAATLLNPLYSNALGMKT